MPERPTEQMPASARRQADSAPWYHQRWPWLLAIAPTAALVGGLITLWLAITTSDSLVVDDYYREGRAINQQLARDRTATDLGLQAELHFTARSADPGTSNIDLHLTAARGSAWPPALMLRLVHATRATLDQEIRLGHDGAGRYHGIGTLPASGQSHWLVQIEDEGRLWRLARAAVTRFDTPLMLHAMQREDGVGPDRPSTTTVPVR